MENHGIPLKLFTKVQSVTFSILVNFSYSYFFEYKALHVRFRYTCIVKCKHIYATYAEQNHNGGGKV